MKGIKKSGGPRNSRGVTLAVLFLAALYLLGNVEIQSFHSFFHADEVALHSAINESNGCHQSVYHNKAKESCDHNAHVVELKKCPLCQLTLQSFQLFVNKSQSEFSVNPGSLAGVTNESSEEFLSTLIPSRAPPAA